MSQDIGSFPGQVALRTAGPRRPPCHTQPQAGSSITPPGKMPTASAQPTAAPPLRQTLALQFQTQCCEDLCLHFSYSFKNSQLCSEDPRPLGFCLLSPRLAVPWIPTAGAN